MKRPEGFDPASRRQAAPPATPAKGAGAKKPSAAKPGASKPGTPKPGTPKTGAPQAGTPKSRPAAPASPSEATEAAASVRTVKSPATRPGPRVSRPDREARTELRRAARERRRYERLEVRRFTRRQRNRRIGWITAGGIVVLLGVMLLIAVYSPLLSLQKVTVKGTTRVDSAQVTAALSDQMGKPLALIDFGEITRKLGALPLIQSYTTETVPPNTLVIRVTEREPVAVMASGSNWDLVDPAGIVVQTVAKAPKDLPVIDAGKAGSASFTAAAEVLLNLPSDLLKRVGSITATTQDDVSFTFSKTKQKVIWGNAERDDQKALALSALIKSQHKHTDVDFNVSSPDIALVIDHTATPTAPATVAP
jgi:cell division protein FtsQ